MPPERSSDGVSATVTQLLLPLKDSAPELCPSDDQLVPDVTPTFPLPELSPAVVPVPSLNEKAATRPAGAGHASVCEASELLADELPA